MPPSRLVVYSEEISTNYTRNNPTKPTEIDPQAKHTANNTRRKTSKYAPARMQYHTPSISGQPSVSCFFQDFRETTLVLHAAVVGPPCCVLCCGVLWVVGSLVVAIWVQKRATDLRTAVALPPRRMGKKAKKLQREV